ncbi:hypothetical protein [Streptomyces sp. MUM 178J]|uniref:hypothetical protein n=1 Tax=Streptomyces sp. MUM 178J TaxID=2791991 RepID=UPI001F03F8AE|nr:hypothetical protein [Streptomyces sp. MUM 178J]WRQ82487.1 hypothetical protein I3F59_025760 [Streptomyces sp. MUM 178J]
MTTETRYAPAASSRPLDKPWLPWAGAPSTRDLVCWYGMWLVFAYSFAMWPLRPWLIGSHPVQLEVLTGTQTAMTVAGAAARVGDTPLLLAFAAGVFGMMKFTWVFWWAGRLWGGNVVGLLTGPPGPAAEGAGKAPAGSTAVGKAPAGPTAETSAGTPGDEFAAPEANNGAPRTGQPGGGNARNRKLVAAAVVLAPLPLIPGPLAFASAGWAGMGLWAFLGLNAVGAAVWAGMFTLLGHAIGQPAVDLAETITDHAVWVSLAVIAGMFLLRAMQSRRALARILIAAAWTTLFVWIASRKFRWEPRT